MNKILTLLMITSLAACGYKSEEGVLNDGTLVDYRSFVPKRNYQPVAIIKGKKVAVSAWKISYVDINGKFGACNYYTLRGSGSLKVNTSVTCDNQILEFN
jgi:hypothetical protein